MHLVSRLGFVAALSLVPSTSAKACQMGDDSFDFIVVGGGTAGNALATRLSQALPQYCVLVVEAGANGRNVEGIYVPGLRGSTFGSMYDWSLPTVPQPAANNRTIIHRRGKVLGGSSALNLMVWDRATVKEYDAWEELGNPSWSWEGMYPAMLKSENFQRQNGSAQYGMDGVGYGGPIQIALAEDPPPQLQACVPTLMNLGVHENLESLNGSNLGVMYQPAMYRVSNHTRSYSVDYLPRASENVVIMFNITIHKVQLDKSGSRATGVVLTNGKVIKAKKEVVLSAGSLLSPKILELSGIGQKAILDNAGIEQIIELPGVGENLQDHIRTQTTYELKPDILGVDILKYDTARAAIELDRWKQNQTSLYQYAGSCYGFLKWKQALGDDKDLIRLANQSANHSNVIDQKKLALIMDSSLEAPDLEVVFSDGYTGTAGYPRNGTVGYGKQYATLLVGVQHPLARGSVHINGSNPSNVPLIDPRYLSTPYDLEALKAAVKYTRTMSNTAPFKDVWNSEFDPGMSTQTDAQWEKCVRDNVGTFYHPLGT
ncbi:GMC oxidoreductase [Pyrenophora tritici-repentis]|nr:GMC oxidoreductase [Pyrenophora tritici-repentis]KAI0570770.1 GMC oxidoreductase [Pyrenophora tritici-repentis]KAI0571882.1 GMC oxidoreductase [Pyrenophora tritici-repentis]KAI0604674.1 GMC oxidoreductase [Pyrenophora tritici-repentis]KAI0616922.1 GMC oxidoreductase [Pyrenophora tritici-repentis]